MTDKDIVEVPRAFIENVQHLLKLNEDFRYTADKIVRLYKTEHAKQNPARITIEDLVDIDVTKVSTGETLEYRKGLIQAQNIIRKNLQNQKGKVISW